jgi:hypothetical protein
MNPMSTTPLVEEVHCHGSDSFRVTVEERCPDCDGGGTGWRGTCAECLGQGFVWSPMPAYEVLDGPSDVVSRRLRSLTPAERAAVLAIAESEVAS